MAAAEPGSSILTAMYNRKRDEAVRLAAAASTLTVWEAAALGDDDRLRELLDRDPGLANAYAADGFLPLSLAAFFAPAATTKLLLERGAIPGTAARNDMKVQALHAAVAARNADAVSMLLDRGADPNARQQVGYTPLMGAASARTRGSGRPAPATRGRPVARQRRGKNRGRHRPRSRSQRPRQEARVSDERLATR